MLSLFRRTALRFVKAYELLLPEDFTFHFPLHHERPAEKTVLSVIATHDSLHKEIQSYTHRRCVAKIYVTHDEVLDMPAGIHWDRFRKTEITVRLYRSYRNRWTEMEKLIGSLQLGSLRKLLKTREPFTARETGLGPIGSTRSKTTFSTASSTAITKSALCTLPTS